MYHSIYLFSILQMVTRKSPRLLKAKHLRWCWAQS